MNDMTVAGQGGAVAVYQDDGFDDYAKEGGSNLVGKMIKFAKGDYLVGKDFIPSGTKMVAHLDSMLVGWIRWSDQKPAEQIFGLKKEKYKPQDRKTLGHTDESEWGVGTDGKPIDPWQETHYLILKDPDGDQLYTFTANSHGSRGALKKLVERYVEWRRMHPNEWPIIELLGGAGVGYWHPDKAYGFIKTPEFKIVGGQAKAEFPDPKTGEVAEEKQAARQIQNMANEKAADDLLNRVGRGAVAAASSPSGATRF